jgi:hypothetical protein
MSGDLSKLWISSKEVFIAINSGIERINTRAETTESRVVKVRGGKKERGFQPKSPTKYLL